jgi:hypothetical protein
MQNSNQETLGDSLICYARPENVDFLQNLKNIKTQALLYTPPKRDPSSTILAVSP